MKKNPKFSFAITSQIGSSLSNFLRIARGHKVDRPYLKRFLLTMLVSAILSPLGWWEKIRWRRRLKAFQLQADPVFIIGHWRSGTTLLHNVMSQDPNFGYCNTFQSIFPHLVLSHERWLSPILKPFLPKTRPSDNVAFNFRHPQEEEIGLGNIQPYSFYNAWYYPRDFATLFKKHILMQDVDLGEIKTWKSAYLRFIKKAMIRTGGSRFLSKNPPHTARIPMLLELFPNAKFVFLYRDPTTVFESSRRFVEATIPTLQYQDFDDALLDKTILKQYATLMEKYEKDKALIPEGNLVEVRFEDFEHDKIGVLARIYKSLSLPGFQDALPAFNAFLKPREGYKKNVYTYDAKTINLAEKYLGSLMDRWHYRHRQAG